MQCPVKGHGVIKGTVDCNNYVVDIGTVFCLHAIINEKII